MKAFLYTDGASRGNPGDAGIGAVLMDENGTVLDELSQYIGQTTNNVAEYTAFIRGLELAKKHGVTDLVWCSDSELIVRQWTGIYRVKDPTLQQLYETAKALAKTFFSLEARYIPRTNNRLADTLATKGAKQKPSLSNLS